MFHKNSYLPLENKLTSDNLRVPLGAIDDDHDDNISFMYGKLGIHFNNPSGNKSNLLYRTVTMK